MRRYASQSDDQLVQLYATGCNEAFNELLHRYDSYVHTYIRYSVQDEDLAEDIFQDTFIKVMTTIRQGRYSAEGKFKSWISRIAHNLIIDHYRRAVLKGYAYYGDKKTSNKVERAMPLSAAAEAGNVKLVLGDWNKDFLDEAEVFPNGRHDDMVDAVSGALTMLTSARFGILDYYRTQVEERVLLGTLKDAMKGGGA